QPRSGRKGQSAWLSLTAQSHRDHLLDRRQNRPQVGHLRQRIPVLEGNCASSANGTTGAFVSHHFRGSHTEPRCPQGAFQEPVGWANDRRATPRKSHLQEEGGAWRRYHGRWAGTYPQRERWSCAASCPLELRSGGETARRQAARSRPSRPCKKRARSTVPPERVHRPRTEGL